MDGEKRMSRTFKKSLLCKLGRHPQCKPVFQIDQASGLLMQICPSCGSILMTSRIPEDWIWSANKEMASKQRILIQVARDERGY